MACFHLGEHQAPALDSWSGPDFPGCKPFRLPRDALELYDGRLEFWDGAIETAAWVCEASSPYHEKPGGALSSLAEPIAQMRGSPITRYGSVDLMVRDERGLPQRILQADQSVYLHPGRARLPGAMAMEVGEHDLPDEVTIRSGRVTVTSSPMS